ncbi:MAG TPA: peptide-methionine (R)-S-oxide reductase, partial [Ktedonobacteraceae bacterium]|nr:peptide-methionine (R)-S-oxide reductase [Ktedonobacteraceae bacterium]
MHILGKGTEAPFSGEYDDFYEEGTFLCRQCNAPLFSSSNARCFTSDWWRCKLWY